MNFKEMQKRILIIDFCNYQDYPIGGYLSFARSLMEAFDNDIALAGITTSKEDPIGKWFKKEIYGVTYDFFAFARYDKSKTRHIIPDRFVSFVLLGLFKERILKIGINNIFLQRQELLLALTSSESYNICYCFAGLENPLSISKYRYASHFSNWFEKKFFSKLKTVKTVLASGDDLAIKDMIIRSKGELSGKKVIKFPTRINIDVFRPLNRDDVRKDLGLPLDATILVTTGRLAPLKGWKFMIDCFMKLEKSILNCTLYFIGEGEDFEKINEYILYNELKTKVILVGKKSSGDVAAFLNAADLFIMGSFKEGWSTSLIEAIACGVPACVTNFSSAKEIIQEGINGFVIEEHNEDLFVEGMKKSLQIPRPVKNENVTVFATNRMKSDLLKYWELV